MHTLYMYLLEMINSFFNNIICYCNSGFVILPNVHQKYNSVFKLAGIKLFTIRKDICMEWITPRKLGIYL